MALLTKGTTAEKPTKDDENRARNVGLGFEGNKLLNKLSQKKTEEKQTSQKQVKTNGEGKFDIGKKASKDIKSELMNKRMAKLQEKINKKKAEQQAKPKPIVSDRKDSEVDSIDHRNLFDSSAGSERKHFYREGRYRTKDLLRGSHKSNPRLRTKTRSKQKNLRKDNRTDEQKRLKGITV